jgi:hypothetical protein
MRNLILIALGCMVPTLACAQEWKPAVEKWRSCADAAAARYTKSTESAPVVARLATLACSDEKKAVLQAITQTDGASFADQYVESVEHYYIDVLSVRVLEARLR